MTIKQLKILLDQFDENLPIAYKLHSEYKLLESNELSVRNLHPARADGWVHDYFPKESEESKNLRISYLVFPGN